MMSLKSQNSRPGFMLTEILVTVAIIGVALMPIFVLQTSALRSLYRYSNRIRALFPTKNFLQQALAQAPDKEERTISEEKKITRPPATLQYELKKVSETSSLREIKDLYIGTVSIESTRGTRESMVGFVYRPEREKE
ncbi:hypothetical protein ACFLX2_00365 [Candidatus Dependentiae bacterium]